MAERGWQSLCRWNGHGAIDLGATAAALPADDLHAALDVAGERDGELHHSGLSGWFIWDGRCHRPDMDGRAARLVHGYALRYEQALAACRRQIQSQAVLSLGGAPSDAALRRAFDAAWKPFEPPARYAAGLRKSQGAHSMLRTLADVCGVAEDDLSERHPDWLNLANGTLDLASGQLRPHDPRDMITYCLDAAWDPSARCPRFWALLHRVAGGDDAVAEYLLRVLGYALLGWNPEQLIFFITGPSGSGKSALLSIVSAVAGPLAHESQAALVTRVRHGRNARAENSIRGARLVTITETGAYMNMDEGQVKRITGERVISVDQHYAKTEIKTPVTWVIILATNQLPVLAGFDDAIRRRVVVIPGGPRLDASQVDPRIAEKIVATERDGILALLARAAGAWFREGLPRPPAVQASTGAYEAEMDTVGAFVADCCVMVTGPLPGGQPASIGQHEAWAEYQRWARGGPGLGRNEFYARMGSQPGVWRNETMRRFEGLCWNGVVRARIESNGG